MRRPGYLSDYDYDGLEQIAQRRFPELEQLDNLIYAYQAHIAANKIHDPRRMEDKRILAMLLAKRERWFKRNS